MSVFIFAMRTITKIFPFHLQSSFYSPKIKK